MAMIAGEPILTLRDLTVVRDGLPILSEVDLTVRPGEVIALLGPNGAGKSSLLETIGGGLAPGGGVIERGGRVAIARQSPDLADRSVRANVELALAWWGVPRAERPARARAALAAMGAGELADRRARSLSGGERRRVHLARVLALDPDLLVLDEPFAGLDPAIRAELLADTGRVLRSAARAALVVVHDRAEAWALADRLIVLLDGRIAADGPPRELLEAPPTAAVARFLGFDGELVEPDGSLRLLRPGQVVLDPGGDHRGEVVSLLPTEDGVRLELALPGGRVVTRTGLPSPRLGETVRVRLEGGVRFGVEAPASD